MSSTTCVPRFRMGRLIITSGAAEALSSDDVLDALARHLSGDWGNVGEADWEYNDEALKRRSQILSSYQAHDGTRFWILTEHDRSVTTILTSEQY